MPWSQASSFLRRVLVLDGAVSGACGLSMVLGAATLQRVLGIPAALLASVGLGLLPFAVLLFYLSSRDRFSPSSVRALIAGNVLWVAASVTLLLSRWIEPTTLGSAFVIVQAVAVAVLAEMEYVGLRKSAAAAA